MADDLKSTGGRDRKRINVHQDHELRDWSDKFGVSKDELKRAVADVGDDASTVEAHLKRGGSGGRSGRND